MEQVEIESEKNTNKVNNEEENDKKIISKNTTDKIRTDLDEKLLEIFVNLFKIDINLIQLQSI